VSALGTRLHGHVDFYAGPGDQGIHRHDHRARTGRDLSRPADMYGSGGTRNSWAGRSADDAGKSYSPPSLATCATRRPLVGSMVVPSTSRRRASQPARLGVETIDLYYRTASIRTLLLRTPWRHGGVSSAGEGQVLDSPKPPPWTIRVPDSAPYHRVAIRILPVTRDPEEEI